MHTHKHTLYLIALSVTVDGCCGKDPLVLLISRQRPESGGCVTVCCEHNNRQSANPIAIHVVPEGNTSAAGGIKCLALENGLLSKKLRPACFNQ